MTMPKQNDVSRHIGLYGDPKTLIAVEYYFKVPHDVDQRDMLVVDPMLD